MTGMPYAVRASLARRRRPRPFVRLTRPQLATMLEAVEQQRDHAIGQTRAVRDALASYLEQAADSHHADAAHLDRATTRPTTRPEPLTAAGHRAVEMTLRAAARDLDLEAR